MPRGGSSSRYHPEAGKNTGYPSLANGYKGRGRRHGMPRRTRSPNSLAFRCGNEIRILDGDTLQPVRILLGHREPVAGLAWLPDGESLVSTSAGGEVRVWRSDGTSVRTFKTDQWHFLAVNPDGKRFIASGPASTQIWEIDGTPGPIFEGIERYAWSPNGKSWPDSKTASCFGFWVSMAQKVPSSRASIPNCLESG